MADPGPGFPLKTRAQADGWLRGILASPDLTPGAKVLATALVRNHLNWTTGQLNPSVDTLALGTAQCSRSVEKQLDALRAAGFVAWRKKGFQTSNRYHLLVTPNAGRELGIPELAAGIETEQSRTLGRPIPNTGRAQSRTSGGTNPCSNPRENPSGAVPRAPDGAAVAAALGEPGRILLERLGPAQMASWFEGSTITAGTPSRLVAGSKFKANWIREKLGNHLDAALPAGWEVVGPIEPAKVAA